MSKDKFISDAQLNAFVDDELEAEDRNRVLSEAEYDLELDQRLCQQRKLKELVRHAYEEVPQPARASLGDKRRGPVAWALQASALVLVGLGLGMLVHRYMDAGHLAGAIGDVQAMVANQDSPDYLLHVSSGDPAKMLATLQAAQEIMATSDARHPHRVEVIANEQGLNLLRSDVTPYAADISRLAHEHVVFYACSRAIERLEQEGVEVHLVPEANPDYSALDRVVLRIMEGWNYVKL